MICEAIIIDILALFFNRLGQPKLAKGVGNVTPLLSRPITGNKLDTQGNIEPLLFDQCNCHRCLLYNGIRAEFRLISTPILDSDSL